MDDVNRADAGSTAPQEQVGRVRLPVESQLFGDPVEPPTIDEPVAALTTAPPVNIEQSRWNWGASDLLLGLVAILVMIGAAVIILQGVFQLMPA
jgi:hypothetical protein